MRTTTEPDQKTAKQLVYIRATHTIYTIHHHALYSFSAMAGGGTCNSSVVSPIALTPRAGLGHVLWGWKQRVGEKHYTNTQEATENTI